MLPFSAYVGRTVKPVCKTYWVVLFFGVRLLILALPQPCNYRGLTRADHQAVGVT